MEIIAALTGVGILVLIGIRLARDPRRLGRASRFSGSTTWTAYYVELTIVGIVVCVLLLRGLDGALARRSSWSWDYPLSYPLVTAFRGTSASALREWIYLVATVKIVISMAWFIVIATNLTMGVAWHRFLAFFNIYYKRYPGHSFGDGARAAAADAQRRRADRLRGSGRGRPDRRRRGRALHLEGVAGLLDLHRVRPLPVAVPGVEHRQAVVAEAAGDGSAVASVRKGALPAGRCRQHRWRLRRHRSGRAGRIEPGTGRAGRVRRRRALDPQRRGDRSGCAVVVHQLRRVRRAVPGRYRTRRPHRRHAALPGDDRVVLPDRAERVVPQPRRAGQSVGITAELVGWTGPRTSTSTFR